MDLVAATGDMGKVFRLSEAAGPSGSYESPVHDSGSVARWGRISWRSAGGKAELQTRSGNSARPDKTWSDWSDPPDQRAGFPYQKPQRPLHSMARESGGSRRRHRERQPGLFAAEQSARHPQHQRHHAELGAESRGRRIQFHFRGIQHHRHRYRRNIHARGHARPKRFRMGPDRRFK